MGSRLLLIRPHAEEFLVCGDGIVGKGQNGAIVPWSCDESQLILGLVQPDLGQFRSPVGSQGASKLSG